jgi:DNA-directed RNA polymerase subunit RPC12/RpoP
MTLSRKCTTRQEKLSTRCDMMKKKLMWKEFCLLIQYCGCSRASLRVSEEEAKDWTKRGLGHFDAVEPRCTPEKCFPNLYKHLRPKGARKPQSYMMKKRRNPNFWVGVMEHCPRCGELMDDLGPKKGLSCPRCGQRIAILKKFTLHLTDNRDIKLHNVRIVKRGSSRIVDLVIPEIDKPEITISLARPMNMLYAEKLDPVMRALMVAMARVYPKTVTVQSSDWDLIGSLKLREDGRPDIPDFIQTLF